MDKSSLHPGVVPASVVVDFVYEKAIGAPRQLRAQLYSPKGAEKDYRDVIGPMTMALM